MDKTELINKFLEKADLKPHELVYWKHKVSNGFDLIKFMSEFLDFAKNEQLLIQRVSNQRGLLIDCVRTCLKDNDSVTVEQQVDTYLLNKGN